MVFGLNFEIVFIRPIFLWLLLSIPLFVIAHFIFLKHTKKKALRFSNFETMLRVYKKRPFSKHVIQLIIRMVFIIILTFGFAGLSIVIPKTGMDSNVIIAIDNSGSMLSNDLEPTRFDALKEGVIDFINHNRETEFAIVSFGGLSFIEKGFSNDAKELETVVENLEISPFPGTAMGDSIKTSINLIETYRLYGVDIGRSYSIIILSDGQENIMENEELLEVVKKAKAKGIQINTIAIGTDEGAIPEALGTNLNNRLNVNKISMKNITQVSGGKSFQGLNSDSIVLNMENMYKDTLANRFFDLSQLLLMISFILLFIEWNLANFTFRRLP